MENARTTLLQASYDNYSGDTLLFMGTGDLFEPSFHDWTVAEGDGYPPVRIQDAPVPDLASSAEAIGQKEATARDKEEFSRQVREWYGGYVVSGHSMLKVIGECFFWEDIGYEYWGQETRRIIEFIIKVCATSGLPEEEEAFQFLQDPEHVSVTENLSLNYYQSERYKNCIDRIFDCWTRNGAHEFRKVKDGVRFRLTKLSESIQRQVAANPEIKLLYENNAVPMLNSIGEAIHHASKKVPNSYIHHELGFFLHKVMSKKQDLMEDEIRSLSIGLSFREYAIEKRKVMVDKYNRLKAESEAEIEKLKDEVREWRKRADRNIWSAAIDKDLCCKTCLILCLLMLLRYLYWCLPPLQEPPSTPS